MGMDVFGQKPRSKKGEYFRNNVWWWRPLAELCLELAPEICGACQYWQSNEGDGLDDAGAKALATVLEEAIASGLVATRVAAREAWLQNLPDEPCGQCDGTGVRRDAVGIEGGHPDMLVVEPPDHPRLGQRGWCNGCRGRGTVRPFITHYPSSVENVAEFAAFLKDCGGFQIC